MLEALAIAALAITAANVVFIGVLVFRRVTAARRLRDAAARERRIAPLVHQLIDSGTLGEQLDGRDQVALARVLSRMSRLVKGDARAHIGRYFVGSAAYAQQMDALHSRRPWRRAAAAFALGDMAADAAEPALIAALDDVDRDVRAAAARSLGRLGAVDAVVPLVRRLADGSLPRIVVGSALVAFGGEAAPSLRQLVGHPDGDVRATAVELLGLVGTAADAGVLEQALADAVPGVRAQAAIAVGRIGGRSAALAAAAALHDESPLVRVAAARAVAAIGERSALDDLILLACGPEFDAAHAAAHAAGRLDGAAVKAHAAESPHLAEVADLLAL